MANFKKLYHSLNSDQKQAVDSLEGPVMVIAGPGTGKTQTIAFRIANILKKTQTPPSNILCLAFTDNAALNMRQRLLTIIGSTAYQLKIHTFHSFCNEIILTNPDYFILARAKTPIDDLVRLEIVQNILNQLPADSALKPWGDPLYYQNQVLSLIQKLKRENISPLKLKNLIKRQSKFLRSSRPLYSSLKSLRPSRRLTNQVISLNQQLIKISPPALKIVFQTQKNLFTTGAFASGRAKNPAVNFKNSLLKIIADLERQTPRQLELSQVYRRYQRHLNCHGFYDFDDMILFCIKAFKKYPDLLADYQERFHYILVDEYQDTNSAQNKLLDLLTSYDSRPNLFVVGDDDQSIFRFQGACVENLYFFYHQYQPQQVVLKNNYRSHQSILDASLSLVNHNQNRICHLIDINKTLIAQKAYPLRPIALVKFASPLQENVWIAKKIKNLLKANTPPDQIAVLARTNADLVDLQKFLFSLKINFQASSGDNVLDQPHIKKLFSLLKLINQPESDRLLFEVLSAPFTGIKPLTLLKLARQSKTKSLFSLISRQKTFSQFLKNLAFSQKWIQNLPFDRAFNRIIRRFGYLSYLLGQNRPRQIDQLNHFYQFLVSLADQGLDLNAILQKVNLMTRQQIPILVSPPVDPQAVQLLTVHKAKGLEFNYVFIKNLVDGHWGNNQVRSPLKLPSGILKNQISSLISQENEEERRLFYVALTRAKKQIYLSYSIAKDNSRRQLPSLFLSEINPQLIKRLKTPARLKSQAFLFQFQPRLNLSSSQKQYLKNYLTANYRLNVTHLNSYLKCPLCFYYKTILRIPAVKNKYLAFGTAVHTALSQLFHRFKQQQTLISQTQFLEIFKSALKKENLSPQDYQDVLTIGLANLPDYYQHYKNSFSPYCLSEYDFSKSNIHLGLIPITGKIDRVEPLNSKQAIVVDYKTGKPDNKNLSKNSDYFRQLVFYKILADHSPSFPYQVKKGVIDFIQKNKQGHFVQKQFDFTPADIKSVSDLITQTYKKILNLKFNIIGPDCQDKDHLHDLVKTF